MTEKRNKPYIWVTWLAKYIAGETMCEWSVWFKSHYTYDKIPNNFDTAKWIVDHVALLRRRVAQLRDDGWKNVSIEDQNSFKYETNDYIIAGKPDIVAYRIGNGTELIPQCVVEDCKTGKQRLSDCIQVVLYQRFIKKPKEFISRGNIIYSRGIVPVEGKGYDENTGFDAVISEALKKLSCDVPLEKCPSERECKWCDIPSTECSQRYKN